MTTNQTEPREATLATRLPEHDPIRDSRLVTAVGGLFDQVIDRILLSPERVSSAAQGKRLMAADDDTEGMTDTIQRVAVVATPIVRTLARGSRFLPRVPWVLVASTTASLVVTLRAGVNEVRVLGSLIAYRLEQETGRPADPALVKQLTLQLYLSPRKTPSLSGGLPLGRLVRKWVLRGAIGKDTRKAAYKALDAAERLDVATLESRWRG
ncbi:MAG TPA: hypothetical protein VFO26_09090 [Gaiella sp.]|uniref:hypothetical protein n=1 Tax=Gaiella sp. TaxID=2663207 RepID=UPI002D7F4CF9|nr:hypothetical protein [Gaiella sp.]HET9287699.1 hypothetical protein [Gaiella sp.]